jgi:hypothetical protein
MEDAERVEVLRNSRLAFLDFSLFIPAASEGKKLIVDVARRHGERGRR